MKLLICTQVVDKNHDVLGFFHDWISEFAKHYDKVTVICLEKGEYDLPENVKILDLGKNPLNTKYQILNTGFLKRLNYVFRFYRYILRERGNYTHVFVHMNSEYVVLGGWLWKLMGKKIGLWYVHKAIPWQLRVAEKFVNSIFTASGDSCNIVSDKIKIVGHGIDIGKFEISPPLPRLRRVKNLKLEINADFNIVYVGRISKIKNQELLIRAAEILHKDGLGFKIKLIGGTIYPEDEKYRERLMRIVKEKKLDEVVEFAGSVPNKDIIKYYREADLSINLCPTGGVDKAVLESMACGIPVIVFNKSFDEILGKYKDELLLGEDNAEALKEKIINVMEWGDEKKVDVSGGLREVIEDGYSLKNLIKKIKKII